RRLPFAMLCRASNGQCDVEGRAAPFAAAQFDRPTVRLDNALRDPQPQAGALRLLGGEERLEDVRDVLLGDAVASVPNLYVDRVSHEELGVGPVRVTGRYVEGAAFGQCVLSADDVV